jgi:hypothetical protein
MTTNVVDGRQQALASDSRWSFMIEGIGYDRKHAFVYVDDTQFDKIELAGDDALIFAGPASLIAEWKAWARFPVRGLMNRPGLVTDFSICMIDVPSKTVFFEHGQKITGTDHRFAGTGAKGAYDCWSVNYDAQRAVKSAYTLDVFSGGAVRFLDLNARAHNLGNEVDPGTINKAALHSGVVMYTNHKEVPIQEAMKDDPIVRKAVDKIANGSVSAQAPAGKDPVVWTDADVARLDAALKKRYGQ